MAKLSLDQKQANKEVRQQRDQAYQARRGAYETALSEALAAFEAGTTLKTEMDSARRAEDELRDEADKEFRQLQVEVAALQSRIASFWSAPALQEAAEKRRASSTAFVKAQSAVKEEVRARFPDVAGVASALQWEQRVSEGGA